ncbi:MAG TPA: AAC(3) family N-acetyltransferase [Bacteroidales bacterium]|nr:AAC(3) family N-acetyltransferase [Bacteroidales bacterium]
MEKYIPYTKISDELDIHEGDMVFIASDITKLSISAIRAEGAFDPDAFINSIQNKLGPKGTLLFPAYNYLLETGDHFDIRKTRPFLCGALSLAALQRPDFVRTKHPLHSFLVWGKHAGQLSTMGNKSSFGDDSPYAFMHQHKAKMLCIDIDIWGSFTFTHYIEEKLQVNYRHMRKYTFLYTDETGNTTSKEYLLYKKYPGIKMIFGRLEHIFKEHNIFKELTINKCLFRIIPLDDNTFSIVINDIRNNKARNIAKFSFPLFVKDILKIILKKLHLFRPLNERIGNASGI